MRLIPTSLSGRLLAGAAAFVALAIVAAGLVIAGILGHFVRLQIEDRLDGEIAAIAEALRFGADGRLGIGPRPDGPPFDRPGRGWYWQAAGGGDVVASPSLRGDRLAVPDEPPARSFFDLLRPWPAELGGPRRERLIARVADRLVEGRPVRILATAPARAFAGPLRAALAPVMIAMAALGLGLFGTLVLQVRLGLRPLDRLRADVGAVRTGAMARLPPSGQPVEVAPLVAEINALLDKNEEGLERARRHVANLAHGLKTPLATLAVVLAEPGRDPDGATAPLVAAMDRLIRHHLARARAAALGRPDRHRTDLVPRLDDLALAMGRIHAGRRLSFGREGLSGLVVACEPQDCDELFGNLLDNAFRHAGTRVRIGLAVQDGQARVVVDDDGAGLPDTRLAEALGPGRRLDETDPGYGFGLPIAVEIAELQGGSLALGRSDLGGLKATVLLPLAKAREDEA